MFKLMVVEDDLSLNKLMSTILIKKGYEVVSMTNAVNALDYFYDNVIDLIISDIMMPNMDGFEFAKNIREYNDNIPILFTKDTLTTIFTIVETRETNIGFFTSLYAYNA